MFSWGLGLCRAHRSGRARRTRHPDLALTRSGAFCPRSLRSRKPLGRVGALLKAPNGPGIGRKASGFRQHLDPTLQVCRHPHIDGAFCFILCHFVFEGVEKDFNFASGDPMSSSLFTAFRKSGFCNCLATAVTRVCFADGDLLDDKKGTPTGLKKLTLDGACVIVSVAFIVAACE